MCCDLDDLPRRVARRAPELQNAPTELVGEAKNWGDDRVGGVFRATAEHLTPQAQHVFAGLPSIRGPGAAGRADGHEQLLTSNPVLVLS